MPRTTVIRLVIVLAAIALAALIYLFASGYLPHRVALSRLDSNLQKWQSQDVSHYRMRVSIGCFCPFYDRMPVTVEVSNGRVLSVTDSQGQSVAEDDPIRSFGNSDLMTVEGVFAYAREAILKADEVTITYDPVLGYPSSLSIDWIKLAVDDEMGVQIPELQVLP